MALKAFFVALALVVTAQAFGVATPTAPTAAIAAQWERGLLYQAKAMCWKPCRKITRVVLIKTGITLTQGRLTLERNRAFWQV